MKEHALENVMIKGAIPFNECRVLSLIVRLTVGVRQNLSKKATAQYETVNLSYADISSETGIAVSGVKKAVSALCEKGFLKRTRRGKSSSSKTQYFVNHDPADWKINALEPVQIRLENYEGCDASTVAENQAQSSETVPEKQTSTVPEKQTSTVPEKQTSFREQTHTSTEAAPGDRNLERKDKEKRLRLLSEDEGLFSLLRTKAELESRDLISYDEALWQTVHFLKRLFRRRLTDNHFALLADFFPEDNGHNGLGKTLLGFIHSGYAKTIALNKKLESDKLNPVGDPIAKAINLASDVFAKRFYEASYDTKRSRDDDEDEEGDDLPEYYDQIYNPNRHVAPEYYDWHRDPDYAGHNGIDPETGKEIPEYFEELRKREAEAMDPVARRRAEGIRILGLDDQSAEEAC